MRRRRSYNTLKKTTKIVGLFLLAAGSILAPIGDSYAQVKYPLAHSKVPTQQGAFQTFAQDLKNLPQFTILGDTDHSKSSILEFMARMDTMTALQRNGVKHICIELPPFLQSLVDNLREGIISPEQYAQQSAEMFARTFQNTRENLSFNVLQAKMILNAQKCGIRVHCIDSNETANNPNDPALKALNDELQQALEEHVNKDPEQFALMTRLEQIEFSKKFFKTYFADLPPERQERLGVLLQNLMKERTHTDSDKVVAQDAARLTGGEKAVLFYGVEHGQNFSKQLERRGVRLIALCSSRESTEKWSGKGWQTCNVITGLLPESSQKTICSPAPRSFKSRRAP